jgi:hypothetical protein
MHIRMTRQAVAPGGGIVPAETILDLPEAEALPMIEAGHAVALGAPASASALEGEDEGEGEA